MKTSSDLSEALTKIRSEELRREVMETGSEPKVVIIELKLPHPVIESLPARGDKHEMGARFQIQPKSKTSKDTDKEVAEMRRTIKEITGKEPERFFPSSGAFVATATGEQLRQLAFLPSVSAIWPNEPHS